MGQLVELITPYHTRTKREYVMPPDKAHCIDVSREYGFDYWDGERKYGYGGYRYIPGYWTSFAEQLISRYSLTNQSRILDVGCGKAFLLYELQQLLPKAELCGMDVSTYAKEHAPESIRRFISIAKAEEPYPFDDQYFDLVLAMGSLHNLENFDRDVAIKEIERVGKQKYLWVESYRNAQEQTNLQIWAKTCRAFLSKDEWFYELERNGYTGDYELIYFT